ncbi:MAG: SAM-dependent methyltransferase [Bdellovibrionaceae bacterium]|nr:SAM-dependent methyltransferase [Pseudobdellovibrionaceae bacterium]
MSTKKIEIEDIKDPQTLELLKALHILTKEGKINQDSRRKWKQVQHLYQFLQPALLDLLQTKPNMNLVDHGAGKSYLGFMVYDFFFKDKEQGHIYGIETRAPLIQSSLDLQKKIKFERMSFLNLSVLESMQSEQIPKEVDLVTALHACDTATDDAIKFALHRKAKYVVLIPCCQAEVAQHLRVNKAKRLANPLAELWRHPIHTREFASHLTNVLRCLLLEAHGYQVTVTEFVGLEHSMKNELIIARKIEGPRFRTFERIQDLLSQTGIDELKTRFAYSETGLENFEGKSSVN